MFLDDHYGCYWGFPSNSVGKESACNVGDLGLIPGLGRSPGEGNGNPLQYSCMKNPVDRGPGRLQSMGSQKVGFQVAQRWRIHMPSRRRTRHGFNLWVRKILWRKKWQPTWVFLSGKSHGQRSLAGYSPWSRKESDTTEWLNGHHMVAIGEWTVERQEWRKTQVEWLLLWRW